MLSDSFKSLSKSRLLITGLAIFSILLPTEFAIAADKVRTKPVRLDEVTLPILAARVQHPGVPEVTFCNCLSIPHCQPTTWQLNTLLHHSNLALANDANGAAVRMPASGRIMTRDLAEWLSPTSRPEVRQWAREGLESRLRDRCEAALYSYAKLFIDLPNRDALTLSQKSSPFLYPASVLPNNKGQGKPGWLYCAGVLKDDGASGRHTACLRFSEDSETIKKALASREPSAKALRIWFDPLPSKSSADVVQLKVPEFPSPSLSHFKVMTVLNLPVVGARWVDEDGRSATD